MTTPALTLPTRKQTRATIDPRVAMIFLAGMPKGGKTSLLAEWAPDTTLMVDTHNGTQFLDGEHYVSHISSWPEFVALVDQLLLTRHNYMTVGLDLVDDVYKFADAYVAQRNGVSAAAQVEYGKGTAEAEALFRREVGRLISSGLGIWFISHADTEETNASGRNVTRYIPKLDKRVRSYVEGVCAYIWLLETLSQARTLHTAPSPRFQAGSRTPMPNPITMGSSGETARLLYGAMLDGIEGKAPAPVGRAVKDQPQA